jgi:hypothetical protein
MGLLESIVDSQQFSEWIGLQTNSAKKCLNNQLTNWVYDSNKLNILSKRFKRFKDSINKNPTFFTDCQECFKEIADCEKQITKLISPSSDLEKESYNEILFFRPILKPLNFIPFILTFWSITRVYVLPGISFIVPFLTLIAPYLVLKFAFGLPITFNRYVNILQSMLSGNIGNILNTSPATTDTPLNISPINFIKQFGVIIVTFIQGIIQPYWSYKHLKSIDTIIQENGSIVIRFKNIYDRLQNILETNGFTFFKCPIPELMNERDATARVILESSYFKLALKYIGQLEVIMNLANQPNIYSVQWVKTRKPVFIAKDTFDFQVNIKQRKEISVNLSKNNHALLTGPNKGGKSTVLRALSISALLAHTYGCTLGQYTMTPFSKMCVCLKPDDLPGSKSRFEREIEFTANTLKYKEPILVFIDELYHSTNPPDALRSCEIYCNQLWNRLNITSIISTHLFELVENADNRIQRLCCPAKYDNNGDITFEYTLKSGICKVSSVDELLKKNGLVISSAPENDLKIPKARQNDIS